MNEISAKKIKAEFKALVKKYGLWLDVKESHKPDLSDIVLTASIKVMKK